MLLTISSANKSQKRPVRLLSLAARLDRDRVVVSRAPGRSRLRGGTQQRVLPCLPCSRRAGRRVVRRGRLVPVPSLLQVVALGLV